MVRLNFSLLLLSAILLGMGGSAFAAADIYFAATSAGSNNGTSCASAYAYNDGTHGIGLSAEQQPGNNLHLCGVIDVGPGGQLVSFVNSGTSGNPITIIFESGAVVQSAHFQNGYGGGAGGISMNGQSWIVINGNNTGWILNTLTGSSGATNCPGSSRTNTATCTFNTSGSNATTLITANGSSNITIENLQIGPVDINTAGDTSQTVQQAQAIDAQGSNISVIGNTIHDGGWMVNFFFNNGDSNYVFENNVGSNFVHMVALATEVASAGCVAPCLFYEGNQLSSGTNWSVSGGGTSCAGNHINGLHLYGDGSSYEDGLYIANNEFSGTWGDCTDGFIYTDNNSSSPGVRNFYMANNVGVVTNTTISGGLTNGWFGIGGNTSPSGTQRVINNTLIGNSTINANNTVGWRLNAGMANLLFNNNTSIGFGTPISTQSGLTPGSIDYNVYSAGNTGGTGYVWQDGTVSGGGFSGWKTACSCDSHSVGTSALSQYTSLGAPNSGAPTIEWGVNFGSIASGNLAFLADDTTLAGTRTPIARPATATCSTQGTSSCWDVGAYQYGAIISVTGSGSGSVSSSPSGISCPPTCSANFAGGTVVTLTATPGSGYTFSGWGGGKCSGTGTCKVTVAGPVQVTAKFTKD